MRGLDRASIVIFAKPFSVGLDDEDRAAIAGLPKNKRCVNPGFAPA